MNTQSDMSYLEEYDEHLKCMQEIHGEEFNHEVTKNSLHRENHEEYREESEDGVISVPKVLMNHAIDSEEEKRKLKWCIEKKCEDHGKEVEAQECEVKDIIIASRSVGERIKCVRRRNGGGKVGRGEDGTCGVGQEGGGHQRR